MKKKTLLFHLNDFGWRNISYGNTGAKILEGEVSGTLTISSNDVFMSSTTSWSNAADKTVRFSVYWLQVFITRRGCTI
ncbi:hypothetical protein OH814_05215 [Chryseobacterium sp. CFS15]|nr:hypothetical protein [Chryseobacterium sp. CFS15]MDQ8141445.1 hypothetical protein [Chryseobacterium sp. CFS15]